MYDIEKIKWLIRILIEFLSSVDGGSYFEQMNYLQRVIDLNESKDTSVFIEQINSSELWGGSGSVWESEYGMTTEQRNRFENILLQLLLSMKEKNILEKRAKKVLKVLEKKK